MENLFNQTLLKESREIFINNEPHKVFFRRKDSYTIMFAPVDEQIQLGALFMYMNEPYLILKHITDTNTTYNKYQCQKCNDMFKIQFADMVAEFNCINNSMSGTLNANKDGTTTTSKTEFIISLDDISKRIDINQRFMCGYNSMAWKIIDLNYINGLIYLSVDRSPLTENDDIENMIADKIDTPVEPPVTVGDIVIEPFGEPYSLMEYTGEQEFICSIDGVAEPVFTYTFTDNSNYTFRSDGNKFYCECLNGTNEIVEIDITETTTNKSFKFNVKLQMFV